uniref:Sec1 family domain-containing protein 2-like n=1 Tax=Saccoglossus kowalevskii TaxID=10224 RepID=A0ABM0MG99_SACKO|nr:PREDICTED: sec1 family domain-containing protein 2-like [Saccoglossus kowalevskii]
MAAGIRSIHGCSSASWESVYPKVRRAVVFMDNACAECLHWNGGASQLFTNGAHDIKEFSSFESGSASQVKAVFIVSTPLIGRTASIIKDIVSGSNFQYCIVITAATPEVHFYVKNETYDPALESRLFGEFEEQMLLWMGNMNYTTEILCVPLFTASVCPSLFITPGHTSLFPLLPSDLRRLQEYRKHKDKKPIESLSDVEFSMLPKELQNKIKMFVCSMSSLLDQLKVNEDCYSVGTLSAIIASELAGLQSAKSRRKSAANKASIVFIDRSLDLVGPTGHHGDTLADKVIAVLPRLPCHSSDVAVNMADLCSEGSQYCSDVLVPGCLAHPGDSAASSLLNAMITSKHKECLMEINRQIVEAASEEGLPLQLTGRIGRVTADSIHTHLKLFKGQTEAFRKHAGLLQVALACVKTLKHDSYSTMENLLSIEKMLMLNTGDIDCPSAISQIMNLLEKQENRHKLEDILILLVFIYALLGEDSDESATEEKEIQDKLVDMIVKESDHSENIRHVFESGSFQHAASYRPLLKQIVDEIFNPNKPDLIDIEYKSSGLKDLLKSGFGLFMNVNKPRPNNHPLLILYVIGGVTSSEIRMVKEAVAAHRSSIQVIIGSTSIIKPTDIIHQVFSQDNLFPDEL